MSLILTFETVLITKVPSQCSKGKHHCLIHHSDLNKEIFKTPFRKDCHTTIKTYFLNYTNQKLKPMWFQSLTTFCEHRADNPILLVKNVLYLSQVRCDCSKAMQCTPTCESAWFEIFLFVGIKEPLIYWMFILLFIYWFYHLSSPSSSPGIIITIIITCHHHHHHHHLSLVERIFFPLGTGDDGDWGGWSTGGSELSWTGTMKRSDGWQFECLLLFLVDK